MPHKRRWADLSEKTRRRLLVGVVLEGFLKILALVDIKGRPARDIRGSKARWVLAVILVNSAGAVPIAYLAYGRRRRSRDY